MSDSVLILSLELATRGGSVCVTRGQTVLASSVGDPLVSHSNSLLADIKQVLSDARSRLDQVELFAVAAGPGSFTGLRIGLATVKAFSQTLGRPCIGVPTLHVIASAAGPSTATVAAFPAGRGEVFTQLLSVAADGTITEFDRPAHLSPRNMLERYSHLADLKWAGLGAHAHRDEISQRAAESGIRFRAETDNATSITSAPGWVLARNEAILARKVGALALKQLLLDRLESAAALKAIYVRPSDAELKQQCR